MDDYELSILKQMQEARRKISKDERLEQLEIWASGKYSWHHNICRDRDVSPIILILLALFDCTHPLIFHDKDTLHWSLTGCMVRIIQVELNEEIIPISTQKPELSTGSD